MHPGPDAFQMSTSISVSRNSIIRQRKPCRRAFPDAGACVRPRRSRSSARPPTGLLAVLHCGSSSSYLLAIPAAVRALEIDPNLAIARGYMGLARVFIGRAEETEAHVLEALRLSPRDVYAYLWFFNVGFAKACLGRCDEALPWLQKSIDANRNNACRRSSARRADVHRFSRSREKARSSLRTTC
jgi:tetratricopeptide (TPR) repeat protein